MLHDLDQAAPRDYSKFHLFFHLPRQPQNHADLYEPLKTSLLWAMKRWPILTGRVVQGNNRGKAAVLYDNTKPYTIDDLTRNQVTTSAELQENYEDLAENGMPFNRHLVDLFTRTPNRPLPAVAGGAPVLRIHFCILENGFVISIYKHHSVFDGSALDLFVRYWAHKHRQLRHGSVFHDWPKREVVCTTAELPNAVTVSDRRESAHVPHGYALKIPGLVAPSSSNQGAPVGRIFKFEVGFLKDMATQIERSYNTRVSTQDVLTALLWIYVTQARSTHLRESRSRMFIPVDIRKLLWPDVQNLEYMGNAVMWTYAEFSVVKLVEAAGHYSYAGGDLMMLGKIAEEIRKAIIKVDKDYVLHRLAWFRNGTFDFRDVAPDANYNNGPDLYLTSWRHLFVDADFGGPLGRPQFVRKPYQPVDGANILYPQCRGEGRADGTKDHLELYVQLNENDMDKLCRRDEGFGLWADEIVYEMEEPSLGV